MKKAVCFILLIHGKQNLQKPIKKHVTKSWVNKTFTNRIPSVSAFSLPSILIRTQTSEGSRHLCGGGGQEAGRGIFTVVE